MGRATDGFRDSAPEQSKGLGWARVRFYDISKGPREEDSARVRDTGMGGGGGGTASK